MIYPTRLAVLATAAGAPVALVFAALEPGRWYLALAWPLAMVLLCALDALRASAQAVAAVDLPGHAYVGEVRDCAVTVSVGSRPRSAWVSLSASPLIGMESDGRARVALDAGRGAVLLTLTMLRRGAARIERLWLRWTGPLGLIWRQSTVELDAGFPVLPDLRPVHEEGPRVFQRFALEGLISQLSYGEGSDFDALVDFRQGMDRRAIDWKQSGRHAKLLAKQYRTERNNQIVFALDTGRQMSEPVAGLARIDRCVSAMLLTAWIALKLGDRVAINAFASRPQALSGFVSGSAGFAELQRAASDIEYGAEETNYTFALTALAARLTRRSMIILFTEFTDLVSADFLLRAMRRLVETHLVLVVVLRDEELEAITAAYPEKADDITRAITAAALLKDRRLVLSRLRHLGVHVIESGYDEVSQQLVRSYIELKKEGPVVSAEVAALADAPLVNATRFRQAHANDWERLEEIVRRIEKRSIRSLSDEDLLALPGLYRTTLSSLSVARDTSLDRALLAYLERLCTRAYFQIYGVQTPAWRQIAGFFAHGWPQAVRALWRETLFCVSLTFGAALLAFLLVSAEPSWFYSIIPQGLAGGRDPSASAEVLRGTLYQEQKDWLATFAAFLFTHNSQIAIFAFALGFAFAVPTILLILYNGLMLGAFFAVFAAKGLGFNVLGWLMIHGTTEIFAICIAGAAGMRIGLAIAFPGDAARMDAAVRAGRLAATAVGGAVIMLGVAGLLEGIGRQTITSDTMRMLIGLAVLTGWLAYFYALPAVIAARGQ